MQVRLRKSREVYDISRLRGARSQPHPMHTHWDWCSDIQCDSSHEFAPQPDLYGEQAIDVMWLLEGIHGDLLQRMVHQIQQRMINRLKGCIGGEVV